METSGKELLEHWDYAAEKGLMPKNTAAALKTVCAQVLSVLDGWQSQDMKTLDSEKVFKQFQNLKGKNFTPQSLLTYRQRFQKAIKSFIEFKNDPTGWQPRTHKRSKNKEQSNGNSMADQSFDVPVKEQESSQNWVQYPFPIREGQVAKLFLPRDLKTSEAKRLAAFMATLAIDYQPDEN